MKSITIGKIKIGAGNPLVLIAGPCVIESESAAFQTAQKLKKSCEKLKLPLIFKASYDKANRTSIESFRGPGLKKGLEVLKKIKSKLGLPLLVDIHCSKDAETVSKVADIIQIPAFLCRQTDLIVAAAKTGRPVNVKKGQFLSPYDMKNVIKKIESTGNKNILLTERGTTFGYNNLVVDMRSIVIMKNFGYPVIYDATHSVQLPGGLGTQTGGQSEFIPPLSKAAVAVGVDAIFAEVHHDPKNAFSDGANALKLSDFENYLIDVLKIYGQGH